MDRERMRESGVHKAVPTQNGVQWFGDAADDVTVSEQTLARAFVNAWVERAWVERAFAVMFGTVR